MRPSLPGSAKAAAKAQREQDQVEFEAKKRELEEAMDRAEEDDDYDTMDDLQQQLQNFTFEAFVEQKRGGGGGN